MRATAHLEVETPSLPRERPWLFNFLIAPEAVISLGLITGGLSYLLRNEGVAPASAASIVALLSLPHAIYFLWGPITDFWMLRRTWLMLAAAASTVTLLLAFSQARLSSSAGVALLFITACLGVLVAAACGGMMGALRSEINRRRAGSFYQSGSLALGGIAVFVLVSLTHVSLPIFGWILAAMIFLPALAVFAAPPQPDLGEERASEIAGRILREFKSTFLRWEAIPYTLMIVFPACSGAMIGLLPELARDYGVSGTQVAWMNGLGGALLMTAGAFGVTLIPVRVHAPIAYLLAGVVNAVTLAILALGPPRPAVYFIGTVLFLFTIGACYALFTGVLLEFMGLSGKSGSARYAIINSLGNIPVAYMSWIDGRGYAHWGPRGMPSIDAILSVAGAALLLAHFAVSHRSKALTPVT
jgi:PAT family beta-lactamase induction signal transducer AmpG